jgi:F1F0 ATPase subunit 2
MNAPAVVLSAFAGLALGWVYFRTLLATIEALPHSARPGRLMLASYLARTAVAVLVLVTIARLAGLPGVAAALAGFVVARLLLIRRVRRGGNPPGPEPPR